MTSVFQEVITPLESKDTRKAITKTINGMLEFAERSPVLVNRYYDDVFPLCMTIKTILKNWDSYTNLDWVTPTLFRKLANAFNCTDIDLMCFVEKSLHSVNPKYWEARKQFVKFLSYFSFSRSVITFEQLNDVLYELLNKLINLS